MVADFEGGVVVVVCYVLDGDAYFPPFELSM